MGDVKPFFSLATRFVAAGHDVHLLTNENWRELGAATGASFTAIAAGDPPQTGRDDFKFFNESVLPSFEKSFECIVDISRRDPRSIIVYRSDMLGASASVERFSLTGIKLILQPCAIPSFSRPPWPLTPLVKGSFKAVSRPLLGTIYGIGRLANPYRPLINRFRTSVGLHPIGIFENLSPPERQALLMCPSWFAMPQADWPVQTKVVGFPLEPLPAAQTNPSGDGHVVVTLGTGSKDPELLLSYAQELAREGHRVVALSPYLESSDSGHPGVNVIGFCDLGALLSQACAVVHHGGIGTTAEAARAGVPQLIVPGRFDQPDNGVRVAELGLGGVILSQRPSPQLISKTLRNVLSSRHIVEQVATAARLISFQDGLEEVVRHVEGFARPSLQFARPLPGKAAGGC
jgi:rhamnosyltransferase subunit B